MNALSRNPKMLLPVIVALAGCLAGQELQTRPKYHILPSDVIEVRFRYTPEFDQTVTVQPDGNIVLNVVGEIYVSGDTVEQARSHAGSQGIPSPLLCCRRTGGTPRHFRNAGKHHGHAGGVAGGRF
jgi:Polysaccharide biosynthesis/export protein